MILIPVKVLFLVSAFGIWDATGNNKFAAAAWALSAFLIKLVILGVTSSIAYYGIVAFLLDWGMFFGLSFLRQPFWLFPASGLGCIILIHSL